MSVFKCKMCGGTLETNNETVAVCQYCGTKQTLPKLDDDRKANLYDRANHFRRNNEFDKAMSIYEQILNDDNTDAETYWSLVLCRYGIEYVEDPSSHKRIPTVNRAQFTSIFDDEDYKSALQYADGYQKDIYEQEAIAINDIQKGILAISSHEEPFDVFICYKESDNNGRRTPDSVLATELYHELTREGFKVFFSRITLEDKLGQEYEPYIFAALNSAKVMVVLGTKPEYFDAVWVKNEWSRYLALIKNGAKKMLIPAYKNMDPYDLPEEFSHLQAQDMSKLGFMQDLVRGIVKIVESKTSNQTVVKNTIIDNGVSGNITALLKRGYMALEDGEWSKADDFFEQCLNQNAELAEAYLGKLMVELRVKTQNNLKDCEESFADNSNYQKIVRFGNEEIKAFLTETIQFINNRNENARLEEVYNKACTVLDNVVDWSCKQINIKFDIKIYEDVIAQFQSLNGWKDSEEKILLCQKKIEEIKVQQEAQRLENERIAELKRIEAEKRSKRIKKIVAIGISVICAIVILLVAFADTFISYKHKIDLKNANIGDYVFFGSYEQDNVSINGQEDIEWLVLDKKETQILITSKYALDCQPYNTRQDGTTWDNSYIRRWLNEDFYDVAFDDNEKKCVQVTANEAEKQYVLGAPTGENTKDKIFLLSVYEVNKYFSDDNSRKTKATKYAQELGAYTNNEYCWWWLRSPSYFDKEHVQGIYPIGFISENGYEVTKTSYCAVRPVLWIDISKIEE